MTEDELVAKVERNRFRVTTQQNMQEDGLEMKIFVPRAMLHEVKHVIPKQHEFLLHGPCGVELLHRQRIGMKDDVNYTILNPEGLAAQLLRFAYILAQEEADSAYADGR